MGVVRSELPPFDVAAAEGRGLAHVGRRPEVLLAGARIVLSPGCEATV